MDTRMEHAAQCPEQRCVLLGTWCPCCLGKWGLGVACGDSGWGSLPGVPRRILVVRGANSGLSHCEGAALAREAAWHPPKDTASLPAPTQAGPVLHAQRQPSTLGDLKLSDDTHHVLFHAENSGPIGYLALAFDRAVYSSPCSAHAAGCQWEAWMVLKAAARRNRGPRCSGELSPGAGQAQGQPAGRLSWGAPGGLGRGSCREPKAGHP